ncbi:NAD kinase [Geobacillus sp. FSL K6-0789]|uniref:NAD kinase n=1 Tax=Geobacillus stearothermophilus TaxID=1422 RepID=A0A0K9HLF2_GEOSE|nr:MULTISPECIES: NAD kinase [Geobacillus]KAF6510498.1 NAD kinase [Geobacillus stearothermophilus]KMY59693.1 inorganic polyphosphate kinase [Geobacillus stearothermophilus]KMY62037.1 inorganic polyphosphate kinase [Geobacillus stearothermophilus]KMY62566.1 inorganic polyphosphate kinase [Geobacillus stearothermophilus]KOR92535.1 inorganic polyphosphate kinase [Geobacillus stearothermophilus ATCC 12980]
MDTERNRLYFFYKRDDELVRRVKPLIERAERGPFVVVDDYREANIIVSIGDDGAFLQAVRQTGFLPDRLYVGVSVLPARGFYCDFHIDDIDHMVEAAKNWKLEVRRYPIIEVTIDGAASFFCLNECSIRSQIIKTMAVDVFIDDLHFETFRGDGIIVSTPTGSTGYNKSVHGAVVDPLLPCFQVSELASLNSNRYRTLGSPFILSGSRTLTLKMLEETSHFPIIGLDNEALSIQHIERIDIRLSDRVVKTVRLKDNSFWDKVKRVFL